MTLLDGQKLADSMLVNLKLEIDSKNIQPYMAAILIGDDPASLKYVDMKQAAGQKVGIKTAIHHLSSDTSQDKAIDLIKSFNIDQNIHGILVQLPLPFGFETNTIINTIDPKKDIDGLTNQNLGSLFQGDETVSVSASPLAVIRLLEEYNIDFTGKHLVIINNTPLIGLPLTALFNNRLATVTVCHKHTQNLNSITQTADILISAVGIKNFVTTDMIKDGAIVVGLGVCRDESGKMAGDLDFRNLSSKVSFITPNFGGIGPMTIACLFQNLVNLLK